MHPANQFPAAPAPAAISSVAPDSTTAALAGEVPKETPAPSPTPAVEAPKEAAVAPAETPAPTEAPAAPAPTTAVPEVKPEAPAAPTEGAMSATSGPLSDEPHLAAH